jgi:hypothetical protein
VYDPSVLILPDGSASYGSEIAQRTGNRSYQGIASCRTSDAPSGLRKDEGAILYERTDFRQEVCRVNQNNLPGRSHHIGAATQHGASKQGVKVAPELHFTALVAR